MSDGRAAEGGSAAVGAAVSVNTVDVKNTARVSGTVSAADGMIVEALMADRPIDIKTNNIDIVDTTNDTIFLGTENGLTTGQKLKGKGSQQIAPGERLVIMTPGGGGIGDPRSRDPKAIAHDVEEELVSRETAERVYGLPLKAAE